MNDDFQQRVTAAMANPENMGELPNADAIGTVGNADCGDMLRMWIKFREDEKGRRVIDKASFQSFGCQTAIAVASMATEMIQGKTPQEALSMSGGDLSAPLGPLPPMKIHCAQLVEGALKNALTHKLTLLTGGPGTGKTTILRALVDILKAKKVRVHLAAPTGRAAQRLSETTGGFASTIHRLLKYDAATGGFTANENAPLATDFLILDEASMLDARLASALLQAVPARAHLLLVGDTDQLPSVGAGNVLKDLIAVSAARVASDSSSDTSTSTSTPSTGASPAAPALAAPRMAAASKTTPCPAQG